MANYSSSKNWVRHLFLILSLAAALGIAYLSYEGAHQPHPQSESSSKASVTIGGPFTLIDQNGQIRDDEDFRGRYMLIYFGYTYCPDVCPFDLRKMTGALDLLGAKAEDITPIFISIDPERDTQQRLADYAQALYPDLVALTGSPQQIAQAAGHYRVYYAKAPQSEESDDAYLMNHSSLFYIMGPDGRYITHIPGGTSEEQIAAILDQVLDSGTSRTMPAS